MRGPTSQYRLRFNRLLHDGEHAGIVRVTRGRLEITDYDGLARRAR